MNRRLGLCALVATLGVPFAAAFAGHDTDAANLFRKANQSAEYFSGSYGYAVFPTIGKGGLGIGAAHGSGHVYANGVRLGHVTMNQLSVGLQAGGEAYSEIIFFRDKQAMDDFTSGNFEFSADAGVIVITASADASVGTSGAGALMYNASVAGQKFSYTATPRS